MTTKLNRPRIYEGEGDRLMEGEPADAIARIVLLPDALPSKKPDPTPRLRIMWGQHLLEDLLAGRYRTLVCAVNAEDNSHGIVTQLAKLLPTSQWDEHSITSYARQFATTGGVKVIKFDMDMVEVLGVLRPANRPHLTMSDLRLAFKVITEMIRRRPNRIPSASVSFLGARANSLVDEEAGGEPSFEAVMGAMYEAGYTGDVYPAPAMWEAAPTAVFARYPFPPSVERMRHGGF